jgi:hypothetical protein
MKIRDFMQIKIWFSFILFRYWIISKLFKETEKYLIIMAIDERITKLEKYRIEEKTCDKDNTTNDISDLRKLRKIFSTKLYI